MSYELDLPAGSQIHPVFHVSNLKAKLGAQVVPRPALPAMTVDQIPIINLENSTIEEFMKIEIVKFDNFYLN